MKKSVYSSNEPVSSPLNTATCSEENAKRFMTVADYFFTEEGSMLRGYGLTADQGAANNKLYKAAGLENGAYSFKDGKFVWADPLVPASGQISLDGATNSFSAEESTKIYQDCYDAFMK